MCDEHSEVMYNTNDQPTTTMNDLHWLATEGKKLLMTEINFELQNQSPHSIFVRSGISKPFAANSWHGTHTACHLRIRKSVEHFTDNFTNT